MQLFYAYKWEEALIEDHRVIHIWTIRPDNQRALVRVIDVKEEVYLELPGSGWSDEWIARVIRALKIDGSGYEVEMVVRPKYYYYSTNNYTFLRVQTTQPRLRGALLKRLKDPVNLGAIGEIMIKPAEVKVPLVRKVLSARGLEHCAFFEAVVAEVADRVSSCQHEYVTTLDSLHPTDKRFTVSMKRGMFDFETYSDNHRALPESLNYRHEIYLASYAFQNGTAGDGVGNGVRQAWVIVTPRAPPDILQMIDHSPGGVITAQIVHATDELDLLRRFQQLIADTDPDIVGSYNGHGYDVPYMKDRMEAIYNEPLSAFSRLADEPVMLKEPRAWQSSAYGVNEEKWFDMPGRIMIDLYKLIKREHKLLRYTLKFVTNHFLKRGGTKIDLSATRQFEIYEAGTRAEWEELIKYSLRDSICLLDLFDHHKIWISASEMSRVAKIGVEDLYSRGQQIRMLCCIYHSCSAQGIVVDRPVLDDDQEYEGALVQNPTPGYYEKVITLDFSSLYPSIIIAYNICPSTFILPGMAYNPDEVNEIPVDCEDGTRKIHRFVKASVRKGILPQALQDFLVSRAAIKVQLKTETDPAKIVMLEAQSNAYKVSANSGYGFLGAAGGLLPLLEGAESVTAMGRWLITEVATYLKDKYGATIVYGDTDSVMVIVPSAPENLKERRAFGDALAKEITAYLNRPPIAIAFENLYERFLVFSKKMYIAVKVDKAGNLMTAPEEIVYKGVAAARREHSEWVQRTYKRVIQMIMVERLDRRAIYDFIDDEIRAMVTRRITRDDCTMIRGLGSYGPTSTYYLKAFMEREKAEGRPRQPGERVPVIVTRNTSDFIQVDGVGARLRDPEVAATLEYPLDTHYYICTNLATPITKVLETNYGNDLPAALTFTRRRNFTPHPRGKTVTRRAWLDDYLADIRLPVADSTGHIAMWEHLLTAKANVGKAVIAADGVPEPLLVSKKAPKTKTVKAATAAVTAARKAGRLTIIPAAGW